MSLFSLFLIERFFRFLRLSFFVRQKRRQSVRSHSFSDLLHKFEKEEREARNENASFFPSFLHTNAHSLKSQNTHACEASSRNNNNNNGRRRRRRRSDRLERVALVVEVLRRSATTTLSKLFFVEVQARERDGTSDERGVRNIITSKRRRRSGRTRRGRRKKARR